MMPWGELADKMAWQRESLAAIQREIESRVWDRIDAFLDLFEDGSGLISTTCLRTWIRENRRIPGAPIVDPPLLLEAEQDRRALGG